MTSRRYPPRSPGHRTSLALALVLAAGWLSAPLPDAAAQSSNLVLAGSNFFSPKHINIDPGQSVTWEAVDAGHTVTAVDGSFDFYPHRTLASGEQVSRAFLSEGIYRYYCRAHGRWEDDRGIGMVGVVLVGDVELPDPEPDPAIPPEERDVPTAEYPHVEDALRDPPDDRRLIVNVAPGIHRWEVTIDVGNVTVRGTGEDPGEVIFEGGGVRSIGFTVGAPRVRIENLTIRSYLHSGISIFGARRFALEDVRITDAGRYGIVASSPGGGTVRDVTVSGAGVAGIAVGECRDCDLVVEEVTAESNYIGLLATNADGLVVRRSRFLGNANGVVLRALPAENHTLQRGVHLWRNTIEANLRGVVTPSSSASEMDLALGAGVWVAGGWHNTIEENTITGNEYGVLVSALQAPSVANRIIANTVGGSTRADLAWDGLGANICFGGNETPAGEEPSSQPPKAQVFYSCALPVTVGIPNPWILADLAQALSGVDLPEPTARAQEGLSR